jgi:hypothetical protein
MAFIYADRVKEESTSVGTGNFTLGGAVVGFQTFFDGIGDGNQTYYTIFNEVDDTWEVGICTVVAGVLFRNTVIVSSEGTDPVDFGLGTKSVFATIAGEFFAAALTVATHANVNHIGIPGVPAPEGFTSSVHEFTNHTVSPFDLLSVSAHETTADHVGPPISVMSQASHPFEDHSGIMGVNDFTALEHQNTDHTGLPGVPVAEAFTEAVHATTDHTGIPGVSPPIPAPDVAAQVIAGTEEGDTSVTISLTTGTWFIAAHASWRARNFNGNQVADSNLRIGGLVVSTIAGFDGNPNGSEHYSHFGFRENVAGGADITADFDDRDNHGPSGNEPRISIFAIRTA